MEISESIMNVLNKARKQFVTVRQVRDSLPAKVAQELGIRKRVSSISETLEKLGPFLGESLAVFKGPRTRYIGFNIPIEEMILDRLKGKSEISSKQLKNALPVTNAVFIEAMNRLLRENRIGVELHPSTHIPCRFLLPANREVGSSVEGEQDPEKEIEAFHNAYRSVGLGRRFVRIHLLRDALDWPAERFNRILEHLARECRIQLQYGDPGTLTEQEKKRSYVDEKGGLRITVTWVEDD